jgi:glycosyltransferase involved in cell wall biosynthesis
MDLVLLTNSFPYGNEEAFLEAEISYLANEFETVYIYSFASLQVDGIRPVPSNVKASRVKKKEDDRFSLKNIAVFFDKSVLKDMFFCHRHYDYSYKRYIGIMSINYDVAKKRILPLLFKHDRKNTIFYSYWLSHLSYALACFKAAKDDAFCVSRAHRFDNFVDFKSCMMRSYILNHLNAVLPISNEGLIEIKKRMLPFSQNKNIKLAIHHLGVDLPISSNPTSSSDVYQIVSCSYIWKIKRLDIIIDALSLIRDVKIRWVHFGGGQEQESVCQYAHSKLEHLSNISYEFHGQTPHEDVLNYYENNHVDLFINCSDHEGIPVSIMEAMASGVICMAREVGGNGEIIKNRENGYLLSSDSGSTEFANAILDAIKEQEETKNVMRINGIKKVRENFDSTSVYPLFCKFLKTQFQNCITEERKNG